ncbi:hypothetical protein K474DRAFT_1588978, partial [Panus rudis PR-1116 ss-1]
VMDTRSSTPESHKSLRAATATIDELTLALANFSRAHSPEPPNVSTCCCGREDCETTKTWCAFKAKLESRLVLSAEVGQALLERHEAFVRRQEKSELAASDLSMERTGEQVDARVADLVRENAVLEKRLSQALVQTEVTEVSHQATLQELNKAKETISRLTAQNARLIGSEQKLSSTLQEKDDLQQERDSATQRARMAEMRIVSLKEKCSKLQAQVNRLREDLEMQRTHRQEISQEILNDARQRLQLLSPGPFNTDDGEVTKILESLVADNETLKRDYAELQNILAETREDYRTLQEELEERRANETTSRHRHTDSVNSVGQSSISPLSPTFQIGTAPTPSVFHSVYRNPRAGPSLDRRASSTERHTRRPFEPLTPETDRRPLSPTESYLTSTKRPSTGRPYSSYAPSTLNFEIEDETQDSTASPNENPRGAMKSLLLLTRSRGVQTDGTGASSSLLASSPVPRTFGDHLSTSSPQDGQSESSSLTDGQNTVIGTLVERMSVLVNRLIQADALTLTTRLKRQHLLGADVSHLSRSTVSSILQEMNQIRTQFRAFLEDEKITTSCTRKDLRGLFKLFKDMFSEMGQLRVTLNDVILDPSVAGKVSDMALHPSKSSQPSTSNTSESAAGGSSGWIAPLSKLLGLPAGSSSAPEHDAASRALSPPARPASRGRGRPPPRIVPKREAALSASATTVNVEFSSGRAVTSTYSSAPVAGVGMSEPISSVASTSDGQASRTLKPAASRNVMNIFAGAPRPVDSTDPWIVIPKPTRSNTSIVGVTGNATIGRSQGVPSLIQQTQGRGTVRGKRFSRTVDAMLDQDREPGRSGAGGGRHDEDEDGEGDERRDTVQDTLLERTLRPRGLSDSSIHTTYMQHEDSSRNPRERQFTDSSVPGTGVGGGASSQTRQSVLQTLSRKMQSFRFASAAAFAPSSLAAAISRPQTPQGDGESPPPLPQSQSQSQPRPVPTQPSSATTTTQATPPMAVPPPRRTQSHNPNDPHSHPYSDHHSHPNSNPHSQEDPSQTTTSSALFPSLNIASWAVTSSGLDFDFHNEPRQPPSGPTSYFGESPRSSWVRPDRRF